MPTEIFGAGSDAREGGQDPPRTKREIISRPRLSRGAQQDKHSSHSTSESQLTGGGQTECSTWLAGVLCSCAINSLRSSTSWASSNSASDHLEIADKTNSMLRREQSREFQFKELLFSLNPRGFSLPHTHSPAAKLCLVTSYFLNT